MSLDKNGEGGTIVLKEILLNYVKKGRPLALILFLTYLGISLLVGDGVITPAISILSAVEGLVIIPGLENIPKIVLIGIACVIAVVLFLFQKKGTEKITTFFGPIMMVWFLLLGIFGAISIFDFPSILKAFNPYYGLKLLYSLGASGIFLLSEIILCATGCEALYADMGHVGKKPIIGAWCFAFVALLLCYLGQGAFLYSHPESKNVLFEMVFFYGKFFYVTFLIISILATIIASQALISGMFSIVYQGITTRLLPILRIDYTSTEIKSQIYINSVNWFLMIFVLFAILFFGESSKMGAAYGLAVTGTMSITGLMMSAIYYFKKKYISFCFVVFVTFVDLVFLLACVHKIPYGGYWSIIIASIPLFFILIYVKGQKKLAANLKMYPINDFLKEYTKVYEQSYRIRATALYFIRELKVIPPYIINNMFKNQIIYQDNVLLAINTTSEPFGINYSIKNDVAIGLRFLNINRGYKEVVNLGKILAKLNIQENVIFYGQEEIVTKKIVYRIFSFIKRNTPSFVRFYLLPSDKLHGVITRVNL